MRTISMLAVVACALPFGAGTASSQEVVGDIRGDVRAQDGARLSGVTITARGPSLQGTRETTTDAQGRYRVLALPGGLYELTVRRIGFGAKRVDRVVVQPGQTTVLQPVSLVQRTVELEAVTVEAGRHNVDPTTATHSAIVDARTFNDLPTDRAYTGIVALVPQANQSFYGDHVNIAGATGWENAYYIDGVNVTDPYRADGGIQLPYNFVDYIEVKSAGYGVGDGGALGGTISVVTRSGGNARKGSAFAFFTNNGLSSRTERSVIDLRSGAFTRYDAGGSLGGPLARDRLWYFLAYDAQVDNERVRLPGLADVRTDHSIAHRFAAKLNWKARPSTDVALTLLGDPTHHDLVGNLFHEAGASPPNRLLNPDPMLGIVGTGSMAASLQVKHVMGQHTLVEGSVARLQAQFITHGATDRGRTTGLLQVAGAGTWSGGYGNEWNHRSARSTLDLSATRYIGAHSFKAGARYEHNVFDSDWLWRRDQQGGTAPVLQFAPNFYQMLLSDFRPRVRAQFASLYGQASWSASARLRLNAGVRWDGQYFRNRVTGESGSIADQWQPRIAVIALPRGLASEKLTASYARVYEQLPNATVAAWYGGLAIQGLSFSVNPLANPSAVPVGTSRSVTRALPNLEGQHYDEFTVGYERRFGGEITLAVHAVNRQLRQILTTIGGPDTAFGGNPGRGRLSSLPRAEHRYRALDFSVSRFSQRGINFLVSYVASSTVGNYGGIFDQDRRLSNPHWLPTFTNGLQLANGTGPLPNDRPRVAKAFLAYRLRSGATGGSTFSLSSGTPLNEFGSNPQNPLSWVFLKPRGSSGRTPSIWDWSLHGAYHSVIVDVLHVLSARQPVDLDQRHYLGTDPQGNQAVSNPRYLAPVAYQAPMTARLGMQLQFQ